MNTTPHTALPRQFVGPFVGRDDEITWLNARWKAHTPIVTLLGPPGVGKTRLAAEAAADLLNLPDDYRPRRVVWIDLLDHNHPDALLAALIKGLEAGAQESLEDAQAVGSILLGALEQATLLIFDNCEGLTDTSRRLLEAWHTSRHPDTQWWMTSQEPLGLHTEHTHAVQPLLIPDPNTSLDAARDTPAVALIEALVRWRRGRFNPNPQEMEGLVRLARSLDGIPLALTMAAGRMTLLDADRVMDRIEHNLAFLKTPLGEHAAHHTTLARALTYAAEHLTPEELRIWCLCSCFSGGFTVEAVEQVAQGVEDVLDVLEALEHRFFVHRQGDAGRLTMFDTLRRFAAQELERGDAGGDARCRHAAWCASIAAAFIPQVAHQPDALKPILDERLNLLAALEHLREQLEGPGQGSREQTTQAILIASALHVAQEQAGTFALPAEHLTQTLEWVRRCPHSLEPRWVAYLLMYIADQRKDRPSSEFMPLNEEALALAQQTEEVALIGDVLRSRANHFIARYATEQAMEALRQALAVLTHPAQRAQTQMSLAVLMLDSVDEAQIRQIPPLLDEVIQTFEAHDRALSLAKAHLNQSLAYRMLGEVQATFTHLARSAALFTSIGHAWGVARTAIQRLDFMAQLGRCHIPQMELDALLEDTRRLVAPADDLQLTMLMESNIAQVHIERGFYTKAIDLLRAAIQEMEGWDQRYLAIMALHLATAQTLERALSTSARGGTQGWEEIWGALRESPLEWQRSQALLWLTLLHSSNLNHDAAESAFAALQAMGDDPHNSGLGEAALAVARARAIDPMCQESTCAPWLDKAVDGLLRFFTPLSHGGRPVFVFSQGYRLMFRCLRAVLPEHVQTRLWTDVLDPQGLNVVMERHGLGFRVPGHDWVDLRHKPTQALLLRVLLEHRAEGASAHILTDTLYPDETLVHEAGLNRVYKQLSLLRGAGLKFMVERHDGRYRLRPGVHVILVPPTPTEFPGL